MTQSACRHLEQVLTASKHKHAVAIEAAYRIILAIATGQGIEIARTPRILIVSIKDDLHALWVTEQVRRRGADCALVESNNMIKAGGLSWSPGSVRSWLICRDGERIDPATYDLIWWRRSAYPQLPAQGVEGAEEQQLATSEWRHALLGVLLTGFRGVWVNNPNVIPRAENKLLQLDVAEKVGLNVPDTLVSQDPETVARFVGRNGNAIVKPIYGSARQTIEVMGVESDNLPPAASIRLAPAIWQVRVPVVSHLRVHVFGERTIAAEMTADHLDWRFTQPSRPQNVTLAEDLDRKLRAFCGELGLEMAIFDLVRDSKGRTLFLEANQQGQFLFIEGRSGIPLTEAFTAFLMDRALND